MDLEFVVDASDKQVSQPSAECIPKAKFDLQRKLYVLWSDGIDCDARWRTGEVSCPCSPSHWHSKPGLRYNLICFSSHFISNICSIWRDLSGWFFLDRHGITATPDTLIHPYVIEFEICLRDRWHHFLSRTHFWARVDSNPASFMSWRLAVLNKI